MAKVLSTSASCRRKTDDEEVWLTSSSTSSLLAKNSTANETSTESGMIVSSKDSKLQSSGGGLGRYIIRSLWKGLTLPFPALRQLVRRRTHSEGNGEDDEEGYDNNIRTSLLAVGSYLTVGAVSYRYILEPSWTLVDALYFTVTCFTTVGYGDLVPSSVSSKIFTSAFGVLGVTLIGAAVASLSSSLVEQNAAALRNAKQASRASFLALFDDMPKVIPRLKKRRKQQREESGEPSSAPVCQGPSAEEFERARQETIERASRRMAARQKLNTIGHSIVHSLPSLLLVIAGGAVVCHLNGNGRSVWDSVYYSIITGSTIGLGDISALTQPARICAILYIPLAVATAGELLSGVASAWIERDEQNKLQKQLSSMLTISRLHEMDTDDNGRISREEYLKFMLLELELVEPHEWEAVTEQFERLDRDQTGYLDTADLALMAKYRGVPILKKNRGPNRSSTSRETE